MTCLQCAGILTASSLLQHTETVSCASGLQTSPRILQSLGNSMVRFYTITHSHTHRQTLTLTHSPTLTHKVKAKPLAALVRSRVPGQARAPVHQAGTMCQCYANSWSLGKELQEY